MNSRPPGEGKAPKSPQRDLGQLHLELDSCKNKPRYLEGILNPDSLAESQEAFPLMSPVRLTLTAAMEGGRVRVQGRIHAQVRFSCARCLRDYSDAQEMALDRFFVKGDDPAGQIGQQEMVEEDVYLPDGSISVRRLVSEELLLGMPAKPLCRPSCLGLCPECGTDLNRAPCGCSREKTENPFAALQSLQLEKSPQRPDN